MRGQVTVQYDEHPGPSVIPNRPPEGLGTLHMQEGFTFISSFLLPLTKLLPNLFRAASLYLYPNYQANIILPSLGSMF